MQTPSYSDRLAAEVVTFAKQEVVHDLSPIMDYYAEKAILPGLRQLGYEHTYDFFAVNIAQQGRAGRPTSIVSYGCGNGELEVEVGRLLVSRGFDRFHFDCIDINAEMLERGRARAAGAGMADKYRFIQGDASDPSLGTAKYDVQLAFQSLHHIAKLETLFDRIESGMNGDSIFLTNDMVGRNGHMRWPEALAVVEKLWSLLPVWYKHNHAFGRVEPEFVNFDCSKVGFEGIRAEDVFPLLAARFDFEECFAWGGVVDPFVDRCFGPNFDPARESDRRFIDLTIGIEQSLQQDGVVKPTQIIAKLRRKGLLPRALDVRQELRLGPPPRMPDVSGISFEFSRWRQLVSHVLSGEADAPYLGDGFWDWEENPGHRWSRRTFSLRFEAPAVIAPYLCHVTTQFSEPIPGATGVLEVFVNRIRVLRMEDAYASIAADSRHQLETSFTTLGGPTVVTFAFEKPQYAAGIVDDRELGVVVRGFSVVAEYA